MAKDDAGGSGGDDEAMPESLLPYDRWIEQAYRQVMARAINHVAADGLPEGHHFYITFRTDDPATIVPKRMLTQFPHEMTIVLQHQFWDLRIDEAAQTLSVGLSFGNVPTTLVVPLRAITGFADPHVRLVLRFTATGPEEQAEQPAAGGAVVAIQADAARPDAVLADERAGAEPEPAPDPTPQVVSLDAFRKRGSTPN